MKKVLLTFLAAMLLLPAIADDIIVDNTTRNYIVYAPKDLGENRPLLISCHGMNQDAAYQKGMLQIEAVADTAKFVTVFPNGINKGWDLGGDKDINFMLSLIDKMVEQYKIDRNRVYISGFSMGGMFTYFCMNRIADKIAAFAPISGYPLGGASFNSSRPVPIIHTHGTTDDVVNFGGVASVLAGWVKRNGCPQTAVVQSPYRAGHITRHTWGPGENGVEVVLMELANKGHWISNDGGVLTGEEIWNFCKRYSLELKNPVARITSPASNLNFVTMGGKTEMEPITIEATATDPDGEVKSVTFYDGSTLLGVDNEAPFRYTIEGLKAGTHIIRAVATDDEGLTGTSQITITIEEPSLSYVITKNFETAESGVPEGWTTFDGNEERIGFVTGFSSGSRVFHFTGSSHDFDYGLYTRNTTGGKRAGNARYATTKTNTSLILNPGKYSIIMRGCNWNQPNFSPITVTVEDTDGGEYLTQSFIPSVNVGNSAGNAFSGTTNRTFQFDIVKKGRYSVSFFTADAPWADLVIGRAAIVRNGALPIIENDTIDFSENNTSSSYRTYEETIPMPTTRVVDVLMARYSYFNSTITGTGRINLHAGGERCYLGTAKGASYPDWTKFTGDVHIYPYTKLTSNAGFYGIVMAHGGKTFTVEDVEGSLQQGKVNTMMENNHVTLHNGATLACESGTRGFRFGELNTDTTSVIQGYMKTGTQNSYFLVGCLNTDATLAGKIAPPDYNSNHHVGIVKEGTGTYTITGNDNFISGSLRIIGGKVLINNDTSKALRNKLRGATGAMDDNNQATVLVFEKGVLGGKGNVAGTVDNYGVIEPGSNAVGTLTLKNYATASQETNLFVRPLSRLRFKIRTKDAYDCLSVNGAVKYYNIRQDFTESDDMPLIELSLDKNLDVAIGDEFTLLKARSKASIAGDWNFKLKTPEHYTWAIEEREDASSYTVVLKLTSFAKMQDPDNPGQGTGTGESMGTYYNDGIDDDIDDTPLRTYADKNDKLIGTAVSTWATDISNANLAETKEIARQFNFIVAENEMKFDALEPSQGAFNYGGADKIVNFAVKNDMKVRGHCLIWHNQVPEWVSSDGKKNDKNWTRQQALDIMRTHINNVLAHFKGKIMEWDIVNECLDDNQTSVRSNPNAYDLRESVWRKAIGDDYIDSAFVYAHRADPDIKLYLNDYGVEQMGGAKAMAFYNLATRLKKDGIPIDGVGLQSHFTAYQVDSAKLDNNIKRFAKAGLLCIITELDMGIPSTSSTDLDRQAREYRVITDIMLNNDNCPNMIIWGVKDNTSWRSESNPLLYTASLNKKPAYYGVRSALRHRAIKNNLSGITDLQGQNNESESHDTDVIYDLSGRRVNRNNIKPGIYIMNGRKYMLK